MFFVCDSNFSCICFVSLIGWDNSNSTVRNIGCRSRSICFLHISYFLILREGDLRSLCLSVLWVERSWAWIHVCHWDTKISTHISSNPICDIGLIHWVLVNFILTWSWHIKILRSCIGLHSKTELCLLLSNLAIWIHWIREIKITWNVVLRSRYTSINLLKLLSSFFSSNKTFHDGVILFSFCRTFTCLTLRAKHNSFLSWYLCFDIIGTCSWNGTCRL